ncbi:hypothetical protein TRFO_37801 [Tritrichomonas foetus]|uniref:Uncharacterized protein n=1 Tax=Tritrichomonas foetus TaxID=1144522 RepID=A0A1J4JBM7_9EUKA|nr:hypothetical protein TRFO_37801 [Tritrichomonas foetus]|eukprot:OHS96073.1 hypothetical protein TRFO_37801 [Tritrichomonas foetus]
MNDLFLSPLSDNFCSTMGVRHVCIGNPDIATAFFIILSNEQKQKILKSFFDVQPPPIFKPSNKIPSVYHYRWIVNNLAYYFDIENIPQLEFSPKQKLILSSLNSKTLQSIQKFITNPSLKISKDLQMKLAHLLLKLYHENYPLFEWLIPDFQKMYENIPFSKLFSQFNYQSLFLLSNFDHINFNEISFFFNDNVENETFYETSNILVDGRPIHAFQTAICKAHPYPDPGTLTEYLSLIHTTIYKQTFYVDIIKKSIEEIKNKNQNLTDAVIRASFLGDMQSWTFLSLFQNVLNHEFYILNSEQIESVSFLCENIVTDLLKRLKNDQILYNSIRELTGNLIKATDFLEKSLPFRLIHYLKNINADIATKNLRVPLFCLTDKDRICDNDFLNSYYAIVSTLKAITVQKFEDIEPIAENIEICIENIQNIEKKESIVKDIFSLLFLQINEKFICRPLTAQALLTVLLSCSDENILEYLQCGLVQINIGQQISKNQLSFTETLRSTKTQLFESLVDNNDTVAEHLSKLNKVNKNLFDCFKTVHYFQKLRVQGDFDNNNKLNGENNEYSDEDDSELKINIKNRTINEIEEVALSVEGHDDLFSLIKDHSSKEEVRELVKIVDYKKPYKLFKVFSKGKFNFLKDKITSYNAEEWQTPTFPENKNETKLFKGLFEYLDLMIPPLLNGNSIKSVLTKSADEMVDELLEKDEFDQAEKIADRMKIDIQKRVLSSLKYRRNCYEKYSEESIPVLSAIAVLANWKDFDSNSRIIMKIINLEENQRNLLLKYILLYKNNFRNNTEYNNLNKEIKIPSSFEKIHDKIDFYDNYFENGFEVDESFLTATLNENNFDLFEELSFRTSIDLNEKVINQNLNDKNIDPLAELAKRIPVSLKFLKKISFLKELKTKYNYSINSIEKLFNIILLEPNYLLAGKLFQIFEDKQEYFSQIVKASLINITNIKDYENVQDQLDYGIVAVNPFMKAEIIDHFHHIQILAKTELFKVNIPKSWNYVENMEKTVCANIKDTENVLNILKVYNQVNCDQAIIDFANKTIIQNLQLSSIDKIEKLQKFSHKFYSVIKKKILLFEFLQEKLIDVLLNVNVELIESEIKLIQNLSSIYKLLNKMLHTLIRNNGVLDKKVSSLFHFVTQFFFTKFNFSYRLREIEKIIQFSIDKGYHRIAKDLSAAFNIDMKENAYKHFLKQFKLGQFNEDPVYSLQIVKKPIDFSYLASSNSEYDLELIKEITYNKIPNSANNDYLLNIQVNSPNVWITNRIQQLQKSTDSDEDEEKLKLKFFKYYSDIETAEKYYVSDFEIGFSLLNGREIKEQEKGFLTLFESAVASTKFNIFLSILRKHDPNHTKFASFLKTLYNSLESSLAPYLKMTISQILGDNYTTAQLALSIYAKHPNFTLLDTAQSSLEEMKEISPKIEQTLKKIDIQRRFVIFCTEHKLFGYESLNLFNGDLAIESIVILLFKENEYSLSLEILNICQNNEFTEKVIRNAAFTIANDGFLSVQKFVHYLQLSTNEEEFEKIVYIFFRRLIIPPFDEGEWILKVTKELITNDFFKAKLLIEYGDLESAAHLIISKNMKDLLPIITKLAYRSAKMNIFWKCMKAIDMH